MGQEHEDDDMVVFRLGIYHMCNESGPCKIFLGLGKVFKNITLQKLYLSASEKKLRILLM